MAAKSSKTASRELPPGIIIGAIVVVVIVLGYAVWRFMAPPPDPMGNMTLQQRAEAIRKAGQAMHPPYQPFGHQRQSNLGSSH